MLLLSPVVGMVTKRPSFPAPEATMWNWVDVLPGRQAAETVVPIVVVFVFEAVDVRVLLRIVVRVDI